MKRNLTKPIYKFLLVLLIAGFSGMNVMGQTAESYKDFVQTNEDGPSLVSLYTEAQPSVYLNDGVAKKYGDGAAVVLQTDIASLPLLYEEDGSYSEVELIKVDVLSLTDEAAKIDLTQLTAFTSLKYILFVYQYDSCGEKDAACLKAKTENIVASAAESTLKILYSLSIPE